ncbi:MAG: hypothetical protein HOE79_02120 [Euryarchaeota archaeon]|nr:hypothetical protein [Euryarchaeota archaeon]
MTTEIELFSTQVLIALGLPPNNMDVAGHANTTTAFVTIDAFDGQRALRVIEALENHRNGDNSNWNDLISNDEELRTRLRQQELDTPEDRDSISWDDATLLFVSCLEKNASGQKYSLGDGRIRDRFGRFPWGDGSSLNYLLEFIRPPLTNSAIVERIECEEIVDLLEKLTGKCCEEQVGHNNYQNGSGGMDIRGFLDSREVYTLRKGLAGRGWGVSGEEPLDGGVRDVVKHLSSILKAAERNGVGIVLRYHQ